MSKNDEGRERQAQRPQSASPPDSPQSPSPPRQAPGPNRLLIGVVCALLALGVFWAIRHQSAAATDKAGTSGKGAAAKGAAVVPVGAGTVAQKDVPIYLDGLGTVQAFNTVTVRARVDGQLEKVAFTEGQDVHAGDLLAKIDAKPFQT